MLAVGILVAGLPVPEVVAFKGVEAVLALVEVGALMVEEAEDLSVVVDLLHLVEDRRHPLAMEIQGSMDLDNKTESEVRRPCSSSTALGMIIHMIHASAF